MDAVADARFRERALVLDGDERALVLADLHVGKGASSSVELPVGDGADMIDRVEGLLPAVEPDVVVVAGDLLHSFRTVPRAVRDTVAGLRRVAREAGVRVVVIPGNHDTMLDSVWNGPVDAEYRVGDTVVCHGHEPPETDADRYVVGHDHPTITIEGQRRPCYLAGDGVYQGADLVVLPAFNRLLAGVEINGMSASGFMSPLVTDVDALAPVVRDEAAEETLTFPPLGEFRHRL
jgi:putative SbcD/Mre11-related phosphoesterase